MIMLRCGCGINAALSMEFLQKLGVHYGNNLRL